MWAALVAPISGLLDTIFKRILPPEKMSDADRANLQAQVTTELLKADATVFDQQIKALLAELSGNWLQKSWRPILMLAIVAIVVNNYILFPYLSLFTAQTVMLELPEKLWSLLEIGVGGYVVGRSAEKIVETWKK